jgi:uncharacterized small protein (DUF1192 family)
LQRVPLQCLERDRELKYHARQCQALKAELVSGMERNFEEKSTLVRALTLAVSSVKTSEAKIATLKAEIAKLEASNSRVMHVQEHRVNVLLAGCPAVQEPSVMELTKVQRSMGVQAPYVRLLSIRCIRGPLEPPASGLPVRRASSPVVVPAGTVRLVLLAPAPLHPLAPLLPLMKQYLEVVEAGAAIQEAAQGRRALGLLFQYLFVWGTASLFYKSTHCENC